MSLYDYRESLEISGKNYQFYALIMSAMRQADSNNIELLKEAFPEIWVELQKRYNTPGGMLQEEQWYVLEEEPEETP